MPDAPATAPPAAVATPAAPAATRTAVVLHRVPAPSNLQRRRRQRRNLITTWLYLRAVLYEFRWTIALLTIAVLIATFLFSITQHPELDNRRPGIGLALYEAWMALYAQPPYNPPARWYLEIVCALYPILGIMLVGEGVVRLALLMLSKRSGEKEWMRVMASTYRDHVVLCGIGNLGFRILQQLLDRQTDVVAIEKNGDSRFVAQAKTLGVPVLIRDMKEDQSLIDAGIAHARAIIIATNDDIANVEVAVDSRRINPRVRIIMRLFDHEIARKLSGALGVDAIFSASALAAPMVAAMAFGSKILSTAIIGGVSCVTAEVPVEPDSALAGKRVDEIEKLHDARVLATIRDGTTDRSLRPDQTVSHGAKLVVHTPTDRLSALTEAGRKKAP